MSVTLEKIRSLISNQAARDAAAKAAERERIQKAEAAYAALVERIGGGDDVSESVIQQVCRDAGKALSDLCNDAQQRAAEIPNERALERLTAMAEEARIKIADADAQIEKLRADTEFSRRAIETLATAKAYGVNSDVLSFLATCPN